MADLQRIRFVTANYSRLQGLKTIPPGLVLVMTILWSNAQKGRARDLTLPVIYLIGGVLLYVLFDRYYREKYGRVQQTLRSLSEDIILSTAFSLVAIAGFFADTSLSLPVSVFALLFAAGLSLDYLRMVRIAGMRTGTVFPAALVCIGLIAFSAFLPLAGESAWKSLGLRSPLFLVYAVDGILIILFGVVGHLFLMRSMPPEGEVGHG
jgi:hypothetical protein